MLVKILGKNYIFYIILAIKMVLMLFSKHIVCIFNEKIIIFANLFFKFFLKFYLIKFILNI